MLSREGRHLPAADWNGMLDAFLKVVQPGGGIIPMWGDAWWRLMSIMSIMRRIGSFTTHDDERRSYYYSLRVLSARRPVPRVVAMWRGRTASLTYVQ